jgi:hypothetical protein
MLDGRRKSIEPMAQRLGEVHTKRCITSLPPHVRTSLAPPSATAFVTLLVDCPTT